MVTLIDEGLMNPRGIAVHPTLGRLFWTDWDRTGPRHGAFEPLLGVECIGPSLLIMHAVSYIFCDAWDGKLALILNTVTCLVT